MHEVYTVYVISIVNEVNILFKKACSTNFEVMRKVLDV